MSLHPTASRALFASLFSLMVLGGCGLGAGDAKPVSEPSSAREVAAFLDLRKLPPLANTNFDVRLATELHGTAKSSVVAAADFYLAKLAELGWRPSSDPSSKLITNEYANASLVKGGYTLALSVIPVGDAKEVRVSLINLGNLDAQSLPRYEGATLLYGSPISTMFVTEAKVPEVSEALRRALTAAGWQEFGRPHSQKAESDELRTLDFRKRGYRLSAMVSVAPAQQGKTCVQYSVGALAHELPAPADATDVEFDDQRWLLNCKIPTDMATAAEFYRTAMPAIGFVDKPHETPAGQQLYLSFKSPEGDVVLVELKVLDDKSTQAEIHGIAAETLAKWDKAKKEPPKPTAEDPNGK